MTLLANYTPSVIKEDIKRAFINDKEFAFMNSVIAEYMQRIAGQFVHYLKINKQKTKSNIYGESKQKITFDKVKLPALVSEVVKFENDDLGLKYKKTLRVGFLSKLNEAYGVNDIVLGDYILWGGGEEFGKKYEIINIERHKKFFGASEYYYEIVAICEARE